MRKNSSLWRQEKEPYYFVIFYAKSFFCKSFFTIEYILKNRIITRKLANTCAIIYSLITENFENKLECLIKSKQIKVFDNKTTKTINHVI